MNLEGIENFRNVSWFEFIFRYIFEDPKVLGKIGFGILHKQYFHFYSFFLFEQNLGFFIFLLSSVDRKKNNIH